MSSTPYSRGLAAIILSLAGLVIGCGRSPAMPRTPVKMVRVEDGKAVPCNCDVLGDEDDDDDDEVTPRKSPPVQYVRMSEWQEPESAKRAASEVVPTSAGSSRYTQFPKLTLHQGIGETRVYGRWPTRWR